MKQAKTQIPKVDITPSMISTELGLMLDVVDTMGRKECNTPLREIIEAEIGKCPQILIFVRMVLELKDKFPGDADYFLRCLKKLTDNYKVR